MIYKILRPLIFAMDSEKAHNLAIGFLKYFPNLANCLSARFSYKSLEQEICGISFKNPVGLAAGFDKNGEAVRAMSGFGFGFLEVGTVTLVAQPGNEKPRMFRLAQDMAIINRLGFNNKGADNLLENVKRFDFAKSGDSAGKLICGINIGKNKDTKEALDDYLPLIEKFYEKASYITVNISSPNTKGLRDLQGANELSEFLAQIMAKKSEMKKLSQKETPIFLKIAPDLDEKQQKEIVKVVLKSKVSGLIVSNTTIDRPKSLKSVGKNEIGGLSGKPLFEKSNEVLKNIYKLTKGEVPIIAVGGVFDAKDAYRKIRFGASLVQIYSGLIYNGPGMVEEVSKGLNKLLKQDGFDNISQAVGKDC